MKRVKVFHFLVLLCLNSQGLLTVVARSGTWKPAHVTPCTRTVRSGYRGFLRVFLGGEPLHVTRSQKMLIKKRRRFQAALSIFPAPPPPPRGICFKATPPRGESLGRNSLVGSAEGEERQRRSFVRVVGKIDPPLPRGSVALL